MTPQEIKAAKTSDLVALYNSLTGKSIKKFESRAIAEERCIGLLANKPATKKQDEAVATLRPAGKPVKKGLPGPNSKLTGKKLYKLVEVNPRREGTLGHASFSIIVSGMSYEDYRLKGGRSNDLAWDIAHGFVEVR